MWRCTCSDPPSVKNFLTQLPACGLQTAVLLSPFRAYLILENSLAQAHTLLKVAHVQRLTEMGVKAWELQSSMGQCWQAVLAPELLVRLSKAVIRLILCLIFASLYLASTSSHMC